MVLTYKKSGVNYNLMDPFKNACLEAGGNASQLIEFPEFFLSDINEGLGSLNKLADLVYEKTGKDFYYQIGWGNAATILNDLAAQGAKPLTLKFFLGVGNENWFVDQKRWKSLIRGFKDAAIFSGTSWNGGETQTLVDIIKKTSSILGGSATGIVKPKSNLLTEEKIQAGDQIIILASSGVHTNGITLIRKIFADDLSFCSQILKNKTIIYSPLIQKILDEGIEIHYGSHITGHGWRKIMRSKRNFSYLIENLPKPQPIFKKIQRKTGMNDPQMYGDYNMGIGFALFVPKKSVEKIIAISKKESILAINAGKVEDGPRQIIIRPLNIKLEGKTLQIR